MEKFDFYRTDLLVESEEMVRHQTESEKETLEESKGIIFNESTHGRIKLTEVVVDELGEKRIGKKTGNYVTLTVPSLTPNDYEDITQLSQLLIDKLDGIVKNKEAIANGKILFIGLGNREVTPDAVGPLAMDSLREIVPEYYTEDGGEVFVYAPGVTIQTGLETADFIKAVVSEVEPDLLIVVDALAARDSSRLCRTIQLTDTGIHPGSGVGNSRKEVSEETLGLPVIAIGIPTVVDGPVMIADAIDTMFSYIASKIDEEKSPSSSLSVTPWLRSENKDVDRSVLKPIFGDWAEWPHEERVQLFEEVLTNHELRTFVSPKEIDAWVTLYAKSLSSSLSKWVRSVKK
ncbi:GPR endopeptidase [Sporosarcina pasteurii]|uniref:Germination protease n=1 Tax=Sporosarcina pasteurii TaxID=1474 RepID=A0A380BMQ5_SPOPA|nr:GPR endopeptidase [Sporosarcina pasteurii]MDS9471008.1 GPR endopeptidase [Sporosarcina pasteurii]QBQ05343.1 GPR endopeptidase [Sporosarcina pasteurii]SUJ03926.1 Germination protease precursor [Sporosarcina pasteurii]